MHVNFKNNFDLEPFLSTINSEIILLEFYLKRTKQGFSGQFKEELYAIKSK